MENKKLMLHLQDVMQFKLEIVEISLMLHKQLIFGIYKMENKKLQFREQ